MTRQAYVDSNSNLLLFWSVKCARTTIAYWWYTAPAGWAEDKLGDSQTNTRQRLRRQDYEVRLEKLIWMDLSAFHKLAISRHPFDPIVIAYADKPVGRKSEKINSFGALKPFAADFWRKCRSVGADEAALGYDGLTCVEFFQASAKRISVRGSKEPKLNRHWSTQVPFAIESRPPYDEVHEIGEFTSALAGMNAAYDLSFMPGHSAGQQVRHVQRGVHVQRLIVDFGAWRLEPEQKELPHCREADLVG